MVKIIFSIFLFTTLTVFGQRSLSLENEIYNSVDVFVANPSIQNLKIVESAEQNFWKNPKPKTKNDLLALVVLNCNKAYYENNFGLTSRAISSYEKAWKIYQKNSLSNYDISEYCLKPLGNLYTIIGDYDNAENSIKHYYFIANSTKNNPESSAQLYAAVLNLSNVYQNTGRINTAIELLEKTIKTEKLSPVQKGNLWNNLGNNYFISGQNYQLKSENHRKAKNAFETSIKLLENEKNQKEVLSNAYRNLSILFSETQDYNLANVNFEKGKKLFFESNYKTPRNIAKIYCEEASLLLGQKKYEMASLALSSVFKTLIPNYSNKKNVLPNQNSLYAETILLDALDIQAELFLAQNYPKKALEAYLLSFQTEELFSDLLVYENSKIINQIRIRNRTEKCISIYDFLYKKEGKINYIESAFLLSEKTKSGVLKEYLTTKETASKEENILVKQLQNYTSQILKEQQKLALAEVSKINELIKKQHELMLSLKKIRLKNTINTTEKMDVNALYHQLNKDNAIMIEYFSGSENLYSFTLHNYQIQLKMYDSAKESSIKINKYLDYFSDANAISNDSKGYNKSALSLYDYLKIPRKTNCHTLIIVPDGLLNFLPFEALITKQSTTSNFAKMHYLLNDYCISYNNSAGFYLAFDKLNKTNRHDKKTVLGIFPVFEKTNYELTFSKAEMQSIKNDFGGRFFDNSNATFDNFKKNAANYSILHLSTHANSGDTETPASIKFYDQEILYSELYNLNINPDLVVLSACETGIGKLYKSEGAMSIARGFQFAGAKNLLFSLWKVNDYTTSVFMDYFYNNIKPAPFWRMGEANDNSYCKANAKAKLDFLEDKTIPNEKKSPYYWSAFVYYGGIETTESPINYYYYMIGLIVLIGLFLGFKILKK